MKPLIALPSPRDLPLVIDAMSKITKYDKLWVKYSPEYITYPIITNEFLNNPRNYTHLVICPDDLLIDDIAKLELLFFDYGSFPLDQRDKIILSGYCNVDTSDNSKYANVTQYEATSARETRTYQWFTLEYLQNKTSDFLMPVKFSGFALMVIPRSAIEQIPFRNDSFTGNFDGNGCCTDVLFCNDAIEKGYYIYVDSRVCLQHLKYSDVHSSEMLQSNPKFEKDYKFYYEYSQC